MPEPTPGERALRALADAAGEARPRLPGDADDPAIPVAATVVILRDGTDGPEVLMIERPDRGSFAGAWVFPGGKLEPADARAEDEAEEEVSRRAGVRETMEEVALAFEPDELVTLSCWDPPPGLPLRIRTWFFVARATDAEPVLAPDEAVSSVWARPEHVLERHAGGELTLYPPTWVTLHELAGQDDVDAALALVRLRGTRRFESVVRRTPNGPMFLWQDDAEYVEERPGAAPGARHRLEIGALPWTYTREG